MNYWASNLGPWVALPWVQALIVLGTSLVCLVLVDLVMRKVLLRIAQRTATDLDDLLVEAIRFPVAVSILVLGLGSALARIALPVPLPFILSGICYTVAVLAWTTAAFTLSEPLFDRLSRYQGRARWIQPRTLPLFDIIFKFVVIALATYFVLLAWNVDLTAWLASAGILGIAIGFGAKDSMANLFAGLSILADSPFKLGDYLVLEDGTRGRVTEIGIRSTRMLTLDAVEIIIPNALLANTRIINESGGPAELERIRARVGVAYGSDVDQVRAMLLEIGTSAEGVLHGPDLHPPRVYFCGLGDSSLDFELRVWIRRPEQRDEVLDALYTRIYNECGERGINIPFPQTDVHVHTATPTPPL
jgi:small-conductance mechanosensitive channel